MSKTFSEKKQIFGELHTSFGKFYMLAPQPNLHDVPFGLLREKGFLCFYVREAGGDGFAKHIYYKSDEILIVPYLEYKELMVYFILEEDNVPVENIKVESLEG